MKKIYARTLNPESYDYEVYDIREDEGNEIIIDGGKHFVNVDNKGYLGAIKKLINDYNSWDFDYYYKGSMKAFLEDYLPKKENGKGIAPVEIGYIKKILNNGAKDRDIICLCLEIITSKPYHTRTLHGYCQGDCVEAYYPDNGNKEIYKYVDWVEAWYWGTGVEVQVHDSDFEPESAEDIEGWTFYTDSYRIEDLKKEIKRECGYKEEDEVEVVLWLYSETRIVKHDLYELAQ